MTCALWRSGPNNTPKFLDNCLLPIRWSSGCRYAQLPVISFRSINRPALCDSNPAALWSISAPPTLAAPWNALTIRSFVLLLSQHLQENLSQFSPLLLIWSPSRLPLQPHWASLWRQVVSLCVRSLLDAPSHHALCSCQGFVPVHTPFNSEYLLWSLFSLLSRCVEAPYAKHTDRAQTVMCKRTFLSLFTRSRNNRLVTACRGWNKGTSGDGQ